MQESELKQFKVASLCTTFLFEFHSSDASRRWRSINLREGLIGVNDACSPSEIQRVFMLMKFRDLSESASGPMSAEALAEAGGA